MDENRPFLETQCLGIIEAMDMPAQLHRVSLPFFWQMLPLWLTPNLLPKVRSTPKPLKFPLPSFVICGGKVALKMGAYLKKKNKTFAVALKGNPSFFHKVIIESDEQEEKENTIHTLGPVHRVHPEVLLSARTKFYRKIDTFSKPRVGVFLEGSESLDPLIEILRSLHKKTPFSLMIHGKTLSEEKKQQLTLEEIPHLLWNGQGENPYLGFLAHAEAIIVSNRSSLMVAEATAAGLPLFIYPSCSPDSYVQTLIQKGYASLLTSHSFLFSSSVLPPLQETHRVAHILKQAYVDIRRGFL